jgi:chorismate mutase/prephenate dehydratase
MSDKRREFDEIRHEIGKLDAQLLSALEKRGKLSKRVGDLRRQMSLASPLPERASIDALVEGASGDIPPVALREIFREILATCSSLEQPVSVSYCGIEGGFAHAAARSRFGVSASFAGADTVADAIDQVTRQRAAYAVVPFETRGEGLLQSTIAALTESDAKIVGAFEFVVNLQLASRASALEDVERVFAVVRDRAHCQKFLSAQVPRATVVDAPTPRAACELAASDPHAAALVHEGFMAEFSLETLVRNVADAGDERIRYAIAGMRPSSRTGGDLTGLVFAVNDSPGALHEVLRQFADRGVNLTKIQSRPSPGDRWQYLFFIEVQGHATDRPIVGAIEDVRRLSKFLKVLGSYQLA